MNGFMRYNWVNDFIGHYVDVQSMWACRALPQMYWHTNYYVNISVGKNWAYTNTLFFCNSDNDDIVSHAYEVHYHNYTRSILFDIVPSILLYVFYWVIVFIVKNQD